MSRQQGAQPLWRLSKSSIKKYLKSFRDMGIRQQLILGFLIFTVIIMILLWTFQIVLLNSFYERIKIKEVQNATDTLKKALDSDTAMDTAKDIFNNQSIYIRVCDKYGRKILNWPEQDFRFVFISNFTQQQLINYYNVVSENDGYRIEHYKSEESFNIWGFSNEPSTQMRKGVIVYSTYTTKAGQSCLILLETEITPLDATTDTLQVQLFYLSLVMLLLGVSLALFIARKMSKPIISINESAKQLAAGDYGIHFASSGSRETKELAHTLNYAAHELSEVEHLRRELIANVSHDLRTPLTMIKGYSEVMRDLPDENTPENVQIIIDEASRLTDLVNDMLDLSKLEAGASALSCSRFNLTRNIRDILHRYDKLMDFQFDFYYEQEAYVRADPLKISQVVYNLVNNAINYAGGDKRIVLRQSVSGTNVRISVTDTGEGIPKEKLKDIWERYYKVDKEHKRAQIGTGLGLSIVKNVLILHGGSYGVQSTLGEGSTFWFELPLSGAKGSDG